MTLALTLLSRAVDDATDARHLLSALALDRRPRNALDAAELSLFRDLAPLLGKHGGNRDAMWRACPERWRPALLIALWLPDWWHRRCEPLPALVSLWTAGRSRDWELPNRADPITPPPTAPPVLTPAPRRVPLTLRALPVWQKRERQLGNRAPFLDALHRAAMIEAQARDAERQGLHGASAEWLDKLKSLREDAAAQLRRAQRADLRRDALHASEVHSDAA